jgi:hypothetical protein
LLATEKNAACPQKADPGNNVGSNTRWVHLYMRRIQKLQKTKSVHAPIPRNRLEVLYPYRERFKDLDAEVWGCLISSALAENCAVADWIKAAGDIGKMCIVQTLKTTDAEIRRRGVEVLGRIGDPRAIEPLIAALKDKNDKDQLLQEQASKALMMIGMPEAIAALENVKKETTGEI